MSTHFGPEPPPDRMTALADILTAKTPAGRMAAAEAGLRAGHITRAEYLTWMNGGVMPETPPGIAAWLPTEPMTLGTERPERSVEEFLNSRPDPTPRTLLQRARDAWAGLVSGWRGEAGE